MDVHHDGCFQIKIKFYTVVTMSPCSCNVILFQIKTVRAEMRRTGALTSST